MSRPKLAARARLGAGRYDHTVGTVPGDPESIYVVAPQDRHYLFTCPFS